MFNVKTYVGLGCIQQFYAIINTLLFAQFHYPYISNVLVFVVYCMSALYLHNTESTDSMTIRCNGWPLMQYMSKQTLLAGDIYDYKLQVFSLVEMYYTV